MTPEEYEKLKHMLRRKTALLKKGVSPEFKLLDFIADRLTMGLDDIKMAEEEAQDKRLDPWPQLVSALWHLKYDCEEAMEMAEHARDEVAKAMVSPLLISNRKPGSRP